MSDYVDSLRIENGLKCLYCGHWELPPNRKMDNWSCTYCHSGFLSVSMLSNLVSRASLNELLQSRSPKPGRPCAHCRKAMEVKPVAGEDQTIEVELCRRCSLFWFEGGGLVKLLRVMGLKAGSIPPPAPPRGVKAPMRKRVLPEAPAVRVRLQPASIALFLLTMALLPFAIRYPELSARFGFVTGEPFRFAASTFFTSLFFNGASQIPWILCLLGVGSYVEQALGVKRYLWLFFSAGILGRLAILILQPGSLDPWIGVDDPAFAFLGFMAVAFPFSAYFYPEGQSPGQRDRIIAMALLVWFYLLSGVIWDLFQQLYTAAVRNEGLENVNPLKSLAHISLGPEWIGRTVGALIGMLTGVSRPAQAFKGKPHVVPTKTQ